MKKVMTSLMALMLGVALLVGCGGGAAVDNTDIESIIKDAESMTYEQLLEKAKEEIGDDAISVYGNSSALVTALENFTEETGIKVENNKLGDVALYEKLFYTIGSNKYSADMVLIQDGNKLQTQMINPGYLLNYTPKDFKDVLADDDLAPTAAVYLNKVFMYNNTDFNGDNEADATFGQVEHYLTNVWQLAGTDADEGHISNVSFKTPSTENVNMNFLVMLTSPEWVEKLEAAYESYYGKEYVQEKEEHVNIGYKWIEEFMTNAIWHSSDGTATKNVAKGVSESIVYANFNKQKSLEESGAGKFDPNNITTAVIEEDGIEGFGGFVYKMYTMIPRNAKYPYASAALINYILSEDGFTGAWGTNLGYYSANPTIPIAEGDKELTWWKENTVIEDPIFVSDNFLEVSEFILQFEN